MQTGLLNNLEGKRVFVTGASGFIGSHLTKALKLHGVELGVYTHENPTFLENTRKFYGDLENQDDNLIHFLRGFNPEIIFHLAAQPIVCNGETDEMETLQTNIDGTINLLHACKSLHGLKSFVHIATDKVYGNISPITKDTVPNGVGHPYNASKLVGDYLAQMYAIYFGIPTVIIRNANVYGAGDLHFDRIIPRTIQNVFKGESPVIRGDGNNTRDYLYIDDIIDGYLKASRLPYKRKLTILNLGGFNHTVFDVVDSILVKMGRIDIAPIFEKQWKGEIPNQHIENDLAKELIGWSPTTTLDEGLSKTVPWYMEYLNGKN